MIPNKLTGKNQKQGTKTSPGEAQSTEDEMPRGRPKTAGLNGASSKQTSGGQTKEDGKQRLLVDTTHSRPNASGIKIKSFRQESNIQSSPVAAMLKGPAKDQRTPTNIKQEPVDQKPLETTRSTVYKQEYKPTLIHNTVYQTVYQNQGQEQVASTIQSNRLNTAKSAKLPPTHAGEHESPRNIRELAAHSYYKSVTGSCPSCNATVTSSLENKSVTGVEYMLPLCIVFVSLSASTIVHANFCFVYAMLTSSVLITIAYYLMVRTDYFN